MIYLEYISKLNECLLSCEVTDVNGNIMSFEDGMRNWCHLTQELVIKKNTIYFIGNGASAMMASHMAADASKNGSLRGASFNCPALLTSISNDLSYEQVFALPLMRFSKPEDLLVSISSSGNSPNIITAINSAKDLGLKVITITGMSSDNKARFLGDLNIYVPAQTYGLVETSHQAVLHYWLDLYIEEYMVMK